MAASLSPQGPACEVIISEVTTYVPLLATIGGQREENALLSWRMARVGALLLAADGAVSGNDDPAIGEGALLVDVVVGPAGSVELREDVLVATVWFGEQGGPFGPAG